MVRTLTAGVMVHHPGSGARHFLPTGSVLPDWAAELVGDHALSTPVAEPQVDTGPRPEQQEAGEAKPPHRSGPGSSAKAWRTYAAQQGVQVAEDTDRDQVIAALEEAGIPVD